MRRSRQYFEGSTRGTWVVALRDQATDKLLKIYNDTIR